MSILTEAAETSPAILGSVVAAVLADPAVRTATKIISPTVVVRASRYGRYDARARQHDMRVTVGKPNYATRQLIRTMQKAEEPFPVRKVQIKFWPVEHKATKRASKK